MFFCAARWHTGGVTEAQDLNVASGLYVAGRGDGPDDGLHHFSQRNGEWRGIHLARVEELAALARHPTLPVLYGLSGLQRGTVLAWDVSELGVAGEIARVDSGGEIPCDVAVDPSGSILVVANFGLNDIGGSLASWRLDAAGAPIGEPRVIDLGEGSGAVPVNQDRAHPHQIVFHGGMLFVPDYGADRVRSYEFDVESGALTEGEPTIAPPGSAPRHLCFLDDTRFVASGELAGAIMRGTVDDANWAISPGTAHSGPVPGRHPVNYPGDIKLGHATGRPIAYFANRGYDTISAFAVDGDAPAPVGEVAAGTAWPQHLLVTESHVLVAGWDSGTVVAIELVDGVPGKAHTLFECAGAGWLLPA